MDPRKLGTLIRFHRKKAGLTQGELARLSGVGKTTVFDIEKGKLTCQFASLLKVLHILNIKVEFTSPLMPLFKELNDENR